MTVGLPELNLMQNWFREGSNGTVCSQIMTKGINILNADLDNPLNIIPRATSKTMCVYFIGTVKPCEVCARRKSDVSKKTVACSKILEESSSLISHQLPLPLLEV